MTIKRIRITDFKSIYGTQEFIFDDLQGLIKLSGPIGSGKTTIAEALIYGLYGAVKDQKLKELVSWNCKTCEVEIDMTTHGHDVKIIRNISQPLIVYIDGKILSASSKKNTQEIIENELYDVPKMTVLKMCLISFNQFNSLATMTPHETRCFLDDVFGFKIFTTYNDQIVKERKDVTLENTRNIAVYEDLIKQTEALKEKRDAKINELENTNNIQQYEQLRDSYIEEGKKLRVIRDDVLKERDSKVKEIDKLIAIEIDYINDAKIHGKIARDQYEKFKTGICPTCGQKIPTDQVNSFKEELDKYIDIYKEHEEKRNEFLREENNIITEYNKKISEYDTQLDDLRQKLSDVQVQLLSFKNACQQISENFDNLILENEQKISLLKNNIDEQTNDINDWNEMSELFNKTLRYNLLDRLIPHINTGIRNFMNRLEQTYEIRYDQEFKAHIFVDNYGNEISYSNLSTGQRKTLDIAIIFGILQTVIANTDFNILFLDELFSNMDANTRNIMLDTLNNRLDSNKSVFIVNHAEMADDLFAHKIRVSLQNKKVRSSIKNTGDVVVRASKYEQVF